MNWLLNHLWPWSVLRLQRATLDEMHATIKRESEFSESCIAYLDQIEPDVRHIRLSGKLYMMSADKTFVFIRHPRTNFKVEGFDA